GSGKSTLLNMLTGNLQPDSGVVDKGETTVIGYFHQSGITFKEDERVIDIVKNVAEYITMADGKTISASQLLTLFLFPPKKQHGFISNLSGGEKKRLQLMSILMKNPNFLILDEPTNDLDIDTLNVLEEFLTTYNGVLMLVSHDRYLLDKMADQLFILEGNGNVKIFNGNYSSYRIELDEAKSAAKTKPTPIILQPKEEKKNKLSFKEQKELENLEKEIVTVEDDLKNANNRLNVTGIDNETLNRVLSEIETLTSQLDEKSARWLTLSEMNEV
ncbi:MAG: ABC transporter ATP-binding protein, partial [Chitinophagaceae bacterium]